jgi:hypothetical protein
MLGVTTIMPRPKRDEFLRHESISETTEDEEDAFVTAGESGFVASTPNPTRLGKGRRSLEYMMASMPNAMSQSVYALERIASLEDQIVKVLLLCTPEARKLVLSQRPSFKRYAPDEE